IRHPRHRAPPQSHRYLDTGGTVEVHPFVALGSEPYESKMTCKRRASDSKNEVRPRSSGLMCQASKVTDDWVVKGCHIHIGAVELVVFPDHRGGVGFKPFFTVTAKNEKA